MRGFDGFARADDAIQRLRRAKKEIGINTVVTRHNFDGSDVKNVNVGDHVVVHAGQWDPDDPRVLAGRDPGSRFFRVWGYDTCWGSFAQFTKVQSHQCLPKAPHLTWEEAAAPTLTGATAYRMLFGWPPTPCSRATRPGVGRRRRAGLARDPARREAGGRAVAVVCSDEKGEYCKTLGAEGYINRKQFRHWGVPPAGTRRSGRRGSTARRRSARRSGTCSASGRARRSCSSIPAQDTIPTSNFVCDRGGMIVICAGTTGYDTMIDVRYLWYMQKRSRARISSTTSRRPRSTSSCWTAVDHDAGRDVPVRADRSGPPADGRRQAPEGNVGGAGATHPRAGSDRPALA